MYGKRFSSEDLDNNRISMKIAYADGTKISHSVPFASILNKSLRLRSLDRFIPLTNSALSRLLGSIKFFAKKVKFVRFDIETGGAIFNQSTNPTITNPSFVTRNLNTRLNESVSLSVNSLWQVILLLLLNKYGNTICSDVRFANIF